VPAWAQFMRNATKGAKRDWYSMPSDVEKVAICRLTGARATEACRHPEWQTSSAIVTSSFPQQPSGPIEGPSATPANDEPPVYEDLFPIGSVPPELCPIHSSATASPSTSNTPLVDAALRMVLARR